jgi:hypothetical protein
MRFTALAQVLTSSKPITADTEAFKARQSACVAAQAPKTKIDGQGEKEENDTQSLLHHLVLLTALLWHF